MPETIAAPAQLWRTPRHVERHWLHGKCIILGILNVTPDSFSDGGRYLDVERAITHGIRMVDDGADLVDVGGESTRPGACRVPEEIELSRVLPVIRALADAGAAVSIDTSRARVAEAALDAGAAWVNDVSGGLADPGMSSVVAAAGVPYVAMHWRGHSDVMATRARYSDVVSDVRQELGRRIDALIESGLDERQIIIDPGIGFAKNAEHDCAILRELHRFRRLGRPVLIGSSRKSFLRRVTPARRGRDDTPASRDALTIATTALAVNGGAAAVRVHDVLGNRDAVDIAEHVTHSRRRL